MNPFIEQMRALLDANDAKSVHDLSGSLKIQYYDYEANSLRFYKVLTQLKAFGFGATFKHRTNASYAAYFADVSEPGFVRYQLFDRYGMAGHVRCLDMDEAAENLVRDGYFQNAPASTLDSLSETETWKEGSIQAELMNALAVTFDNGHHQLFSGRLL